MSSNSLPQLKSKTDQPVLVRPEKPYEKPATLVAWTAPSRVFYLRAASWFVGLLLLSLGLIFVLALFKQVTLILVVIALAFVIYALNRVEPKQVNYAIGTTGIKIGQREYNYRDLKWFWLVNKGDWQVLYVSTYLTLPHVLRIIIPREKQEQIEQSLLRYLPYHEERERDYLDWLENVIDQLSPRLPARLIKRFSAEA